MGVSVLYSDANWDGALTLVGGTGQKALNSIYVHTETAARYVQVFDAISTTEVVAGTALTLGTTEPRIQMNFPTADTSDQLYFDAAKFQNGIVIAATTATRGGTTGGTLNYTIEVA